MERGLESTVTVSRTASVMSRWAEGMFDLGGGAGGLLEALTADVLDDAEEKEGSTKGSEDERNRLWEDFDV